jgi:hypothetical protein
LPRGREMRARVLCAVASIAFVSSGCETEELSSEGASVVASRNAPAAECSNVGHFVGYDGGWWEGSFITNDDLIEGAMNDLRNQVARAGGNYVQHDPPTLGQDDGTTTTAMVTGSGFHCPAGVTP